MARILTDKERQMIKEAKAKERLLSGYIASSVSRMTPKRDKYRMRGVSE